MIHRHQVLSNRFILQSEGDLIHITEVTVKEVFLDIVFFLKEIDWTSAGSTALLTALVTSTFTYFLQSSLRKKDHRHADFLAKEVAKAKEQRAAVDVADHLDRFVEHCEYSHDVLCRGFQEASETNSMDRFRDYRGIQFRAPDSMLLDALPICCVDELKQFANDLNRQDSWIRTQAEYGPAIDAYEYEEQRILLFGVNAWALCKKYRQRAGLPEIAMSDAAKDLTGWLTKLENKVRNNPSAYIPALAKHFNVDRD